MINDIYVPHSPYGTPFDPSKCKKSVYSNDRTMRFFQCTRKHVNEGWCKQHTPGELMIDPDYYYGVYRNFNDVWEIGKIEIVSRGPKRATLLKATPVSDYRVHLGIEELVLTEKQAWDAAEEKATGLVLKSEIYLARATNSLRKLQAARACNEKEK